MFSVQKLIELGKDGLLKRDPEVKFIGSIIRSIRTRNNLSREKLANKINCDLELITAIENGYGIPSDAGQILLASIHLIYGDKASIG